jgi:hypothetical protein
MFWTEIKSITTVFVDVTIISGAIAAMIKLKAFNMLGYRYKTEVSCKHCEIASDSVVFLADYIIHNTGKRSLELTKVILTLVPACIIDGLIIPHENEVLSQRIIDLSKLSNGGFSKLESDERSIFTLRCCLPDLPPMVFVICSISWNHRRITAPYRSLYIKSNQPDGLK